MKTIALLTDFGNSCYVGIIKAVILSINPKINIIDITHKITPQNIKEGSFILYNSYKYFPKNTIFLAVVDPTVGSKRNPIVIKTKNYYFIGPDNGLLSLSAKEDGIKKIILLENRKYFLNKISNTFHARDIFAPVVGYISKGVDISNFGKEIKNIEELEFNNPKIRKEKLVVEILYIDTFGNLITNLTKKDLLKFINNKKFTAYLNNKKIEKIYDYYSQAKENEPFFIEDSFQLLEISLKNKSAAKYFNIKDTNKKIFIYNC